MCVCVCVCVICTGIVSKFIFKTSYRLFNINDLFANS